MEAVFDCKKGDILNANVYSLRNNVLLYSTSTTKTTFRGRKVTTLHSVSDVHPVGAIHWRDRSFQVYGRVLPCDVLKSKDGGIFSSSRCWKWSRNSYKVKYKGYLWTAEKDCSSVARFNPYRHHLFSKDEPATIQISRDAQEDEIFLMLVFLYSEVKRQDAQRAASAGAAAGSNSGAVGG